MATKRKKMKLSINRCPIHQGYWSISIDDDSGGTRLTDGKCCGQWRTVKAWVLSADDWQTVIKEATVARNLARRAE